MALKKKYQIFVSSTYTDLIAERQAAVQAILIAGHIPAGMELFAAGNESQMEVIKRWIDQSDIYLLILGGRYGSIEEKSGKSYTQLEFEYALSKNKPLFSIVINEKTLTKRTGKRVLETIERKYGKELEEFRNKVCSNMVKFWDDEKDIKNGIYESLPELIDRYDLVGWVPGNEAVDTKPMAEELARLSKQNEELRIQLSQMPNKVDTFHGLTFEEMYNELEIRTLPDAEIEQKIKEYINDFERVLRFDETVIETPTLLHAFAALSATFANQLIIARNRHFILMVAESLLALGLIEKMDHTNTHIRYRLTDEGVRFNIRLLRFIRSKENE